jgi:DMSO reductase anchor subunit
MWYARPAEIGEAGWIGRWSPGIGDPTLLGWITVVAYFVAAWLCGKVVARLILKPQRRERLLWQCLCVLLVALGINKQLDLQSAFTEFLRGLAHAQGWYSERRVYQRAFIEVLLIVLAVSGALLVAYIWRMPRSTKVVGLGMCFIGGYVLIRAMSFHHVDQLIHTQVLAVRLNWVFELGGISICCAGAKRRLSG